MKLSIVLAAILAVSQVGTRAAFAEDAPPSEKLALARQIVEASGGEAQASSVIKAMMGPLYAGLQKNVPPAQARLFGQISEDMQAEAISIAPALIDVSERLFAEGLTEKELKDELAWVTSESGRSIRLKTPALMQQLSQAEVPIVQAMIPTMAKHVFEHVCEQVQCSAQDRQVIAAALAKMANQHPS